MKKEKVFVYGTLMVECTWDQQVPGELFVMSSGIACAKFQGEGTIKGEIREVSRSTLSRWDRYEGVDVGLYRRVKVKTKSGIDAWSYEYARPINGMKKLNTGAWQWPGIARAS